MLAGAAGFEPTNVDSKNRCSTKMVMPNGRILRFIFLGFKKTVKQLNP